MQAGKISRKLIIINKTLIAHCLIEPVLLMILVLIQRVLKIQQQLLMQHLQKVVI